ncbi:MAG: hypothetical protein ACE5H3_08130 [Planctomycetota bacterium]
MLNRLEAWLFHGAVLLVGGTGLVYAWMLYLMEPADPYAVVNSPFQPLAQHLHVLLAPLLVFLSGTIWRRHVWARVQSGFPHRRRTGLFLAATLFPMIVSGYFLQISVGDSWRTAWKGIHVAVSLAWLATYQIHQLTPRPAPAPRHSIGP